MDTFTVVGLYPPDGSSARDDSFVHQIGIKDDGREVEDRAVEAAQKTRLEMAERTGLCPGDIEILAVFKGELFDYYDTGRDNLAIT